MISAVVLAIGDGGAPTDARELAIRSLSWLVSAVVSSVVRDVIVACPPLWPIADDMEHVGCMLVQQSPEADRIACAAAAAKCDRVLVIRMGFQPEGPLAAEIDAVVRRLGADGTAMVLRTPERLLERLYPALAPVVGALVSRETLSNAKTFKAIVRGVRGGARLRTSMAPVL